MLIRSPTHLAGSNLDTEERGSTNRILEGSRLRTNEKSPYPTYTSVTQRWIQQVSLPNAAPAAIVSSTGPSSGCSGFGGAVKPEKDPAIRPNKVRCGFRLEDRKSVDEP